MKKSTISKLKSIFGSKKGRKYKDHKQQSTKSSRSASPEPAGEASPSNDDFRPLIRTPSPSRAGPLRSPPAPSPPVPLHPRAPVAPDPSGPQTLMPCNVCGRTFLPPSLVKHIKICEKMTIKKRKTFDSSRQRREGTDMEQFLPKNFGLPENSPFLEKSPPSTAKPAPKLKLQSSRNSVSKVTSKPAAELQKCPHCNRNFGMRAFERHVEWCADKAKILPVASTQPPAHLADAKQRLNARTQYKAPPVRGRRLSQTRDKSSNSRSASVESTRGVSPPRECGDFRHGRTRASESVSSNDYHEENSPHVPIIRNKRHSQSNSSGDTHVKARQARLARDLSSTRATQDPKSFAQQSNNDQKTTKTEPPKQINKMTIKKKQQLKKLEQMVSKHSERAKEQLEESKPNMTAAKREKSMIPLLKRKNATDDITDEQDSVATEPPTVEESRTSEIPKIKHTEKLGETIVSNESLTLEKKFKTPKSYNLRNRIPISRREPPLKDNKSEAAEKDKKRNRGKVTKNIVKEKSFSLDSLEDIPPDSNRVCQSIGINTELLCVPCIIHDTVTEPKVSSRKAKGKHVAVKIEKELEPEPSVELIYKNPTMAMTCELRIRENLESSDSKVYLSNSNSMQSSMTTTISTCNFTSDNMESNSDLSKTYDNIQSKKENLKKIDINEIKLSDIQSDQCCESEEIDDLSAENYADNIQFDNSRELISIETSDMVLGEQTSAIDCRFGSGQTYTKFTENPDDFEEFMTLTDQLMNDNKSETQIEINRAVDDLHTPKTNSLEAINNDSAEETEKFNFSDTFQDLKENFKKLIELSGDKLISDETKSNTVDDDEENKKVSDMEHITVYELKFYDKTENEDNIPTLLPNEISSDQHASPNPVNIVKLPSIEETNKPERKITCNKKRMQKIYNTNKRCKLPENKTLIVNSEDSSDGQSMLLDAPLLKLPRIENKKRLDENYDPFASAARQMKELMSTDTNMSKSNSNSSKDLSRTLPILRPNKDKAPTTYNSTTTKMMKDTLNKSYQKTPTLQRMKSFGSTNNDHNTFGGRSSSFRVRYDQHKSSQKLNTTFTKSSKENISTIDKSFFNRNSNLNRSFSSYNSSSYSTPKPKDKIPKIATSMYHSFQRTTIKQPVKLDKIKRGDEKKDFVSLDAILTDDNSSMTDSNYIDPRLINENDNLPINVNTILNNPEIISSMESLLTTENLPAKFESFSSSNLNNNKNLNEIVGSNRKLNKLENNNNFNNKTTAPIINSMETQYDKVISSLEQSLTSKTSVRDDESLCEDFDLDVFMTTFDEEITHKLENKRTCSSTTRVVKQSELTDSNRNSEFNSVCSTPKLTNGMNPVNKSMSLTFSSNNTVNDNLFPSSVKRSNSFLDSIQKKTTQKVDSAKQRHKVDQLEQDLMQSLKDFDKMYASEKDHHSSKETVKHNGITRGGTARRDSRAKAEQKLKRDDVSNGNFTSNGKASNDSAYSSLNRISPSKLTLCTSKEPSRSQPEAVPVASDSSSHKDDARSISSEEFLAMERSAELDEPMPQPDIHPEIDGLAINNGTRTKSRTPSLRSPTWRKHGDLSSSSSEVSLHPCRRDSAPAPRLSRFCHECGTRFSVDTAKFCIECGVKRLTV